MTCPPTCPRYCFTLSPDCPMRSAQHSSNTFTEVRPVTTSPSGYVAPERPWGPLPSSDTERALMLLREAWRTVRDMETSLFYSKREALSDIESAAQWIADL